MRRDRDAGGGRSEPPESSDRGGERFRADADDASLGFETVILPARVDSDVARRVAIASNRDGISVADLLGKAAAAYDWRIEDTSGQRDRRG